MTEAPDTTAARRLAILEAATPVFLRYGYKKTSMDDLARAAGLSRQGLYLHFENKEALFKAGRPPFAVQSRATGGPSLPPAGMGIGDRQLGRLFRPRRHGAGQ